MSSRFLNSRDLFQGFSVVIAMWLLAYANSPQAKQDSLQKVTQVYIRSGESDKDKRFDYNYQALNLALEKTRAEFGDFQLHHAPPMNFMRAINTLRTNSLPNLIIKQSYSDSIIDENIVYSDFPVDLGIVGYRVCFVSPQKQASFAQAKNIDDLKSFVFGQGRGWMDVQILQAHGIPVKESGSYESLFSLVSGGQIDLFCRGANELMQELAMRSNINDLIADEHILIYYPLPRFFMSNASNTALIKRVESGLKLAFEDGSFTRLWNKMYGEPIQQAQLPGRTRIELSNPLITEENLSYQQYIDKAHEQLYSSSKFIP